MLDNVKVGVGDSTGAAVFVSMEAGVSETIGCMEDGPAFASSFSEDAAA